MLFVGRVHDVRQAMYYCVHGLGTSSLPKAASVVASRGDHFSSLDPKTIPAYVSCYVLAWLGSQTSVAGLSMCSVAGLGKNIQDQGMLEVIDVTTK